MILVRGQASVTLKSTEGASGQWPRPDRLRHRHGEQRTDVSIVLMIFCFLDIFC